ncbi:MAG TPA: helix-turn-helix transcriptional regulator, partial [Pseudomonadota bacterium]|nr:helix-turn-helix transcriptional regulator [Pseudomonadota bacterium]
MASLRRQRERAGLSRAELAHKCGLSESTIRNLETGRHVPCAQTLQAIATVLNPLGPANPPIGPSLAVTPQLGFAPDRGPGVWLGSDDMLHLY